jgi:NADH:ubiquinone oxidoreductase subunit 5 (subunit L)/multisubunit Na+/H+ antiporter MnhA subunit
VHHEHEDESEVAADHDSARDHGAHVVTGTAGYHPHESPLSMLVPLGLLSLGAVLAGFAFEHVFVSPEGGPEFWRGSLAFSEHLAHAAHEVPLWVKLTPLAVMLVGLALAYRNYIRVPSSRGPLITATAMKIFRGERVGTIFGTISIGSGLGSALGAWAGGLIHDWTHSYNPVMAFALVAVVLGLIPFLVVPALRR